VISGHSWTWSGALCHGLVHPRQHTYCLEGERLGLYLLSARVAGRCLGSGCEALGASQLCHSQDTGVGGSGFVLLVFLLPSGASLPW
jgi:hypothetical protein